MSFRISHSEILASYAILPSNELGEPVISLERELYKARVPERLQACYMARRDGGGFHRRLPTSLFVSSKDR